MTGQFFEPSAVPYVNLERARRDVLSFNVLKWQRVYARADQRRRVESLMGSNAAIPRRTLERFGLWDECTPIEDEPSLAYRINAAKREDEYLLFDPAITMMPPLIRLMAIEAAASRVRCRPGRCSGSWPSWNWRATAGSKHSG